MDRFLLRIWSLVAPLWIWLIMGVSVFAGMTIMEDTNLVLAYLQLPAFLAIPLSHQADVPVIRWLAGFIACFVVFFVLGYVVQAFFDAIRLRIVIQSISWILKRCDFDSGRRQPNTTFWWYYPLFTLLWRDFTDSLHAQTVTTETGESNICYRSTIPAEVFFSQQALVDNPMRAEFFRYLPGMLTGAGIVCTFAGILLGLVEFDPTVEPEAVTAQLKNLFTGVSTAFVASFFAIFFAISITIIEKMILQWRYSQVILLQNRMDDLFKGGIEEEYLAELVKANANQHQNFHGLSETIKQGLLTKPNAEDATAQTDRLTAALTAVLKANNNDLAVQLRGAISASLEQPIATMSQSMQVAMGMYSHIGQRTNSFNTSIEALTHTMTSIQEVLVANKNLTEQVAAVVAESNKTTVALLNRKDTSATPQIATEMTQTQTSQQEILIANNNLTEQVASTAVELKQIVSALLEKDTKATQQIASEMTHTQMSQQEILIANNSLTEQVASTVAELNETISALLERDTNVVQQIVSEMTQAKTSLQEILITNNNLTEQMGSTVAELNQTISALLEKNTSETTEQSTTSMINNALVANSEKTADSLAELGQSTNAIGKTITARIDCSNQSLQHIAKQADTLLFKLEEHASTTQLEKTTETNQLNQILDRFDNHGKLLMENVAEVFSNKMNGAVEQVTTNVETLVAEQNTQTQARDEQLMTRINQQLAHTIDGLAVGIMEMRQQLDDGNTSLQTTIERVVDGFDETTDQKTNQLSQQFEQVLTNTAIQQTQMIDTLVDFSKGLRADMDQLQQGVQANGQHLQKELLQQSENQLRSQENNSTQRMDTLAASLTEHIKTNVDTLTQQQHQRSDQLMAQIETVKDDSAEHNEQLQAEVLKQLSGSVNQVSSNIKMMTEKQTFHAEQTADSLLTMLSLKINDMEHGFNQGFVDIRQRLQEEHTAFQTSLVERFNDVTKLSHEDNIRLADLLKHEMAQVDQRQKSLVSSLDQVTANFSHDIVELKDGLLTNEQAMTDHLTTQMNDVVARYSKEQGLFIEMLGQRLDTLRKRLKI